MPGPPKSNQKFTINKIFNLQDPLDDIPLSEKEIQNIFLPSTETLTLQLLRKHQYLDHVIRQLKFWLKRNTKPVKADITVLGKEPFFDISEKKLHDDKQKQ